MTKNLLLAFFMFSYQTSQIKYSEDSIIGIWLTEDKQAKIDISQSEKAEYQGKIVWLKEPINPETGEQWLDIENPDKNKAILPLINSVMLWNFIFENKEYINGKVYDSNNGKTYSGKMWLENETTLKLRGYWGPFYRTETWTKVK